MSVQTSSADSFVGLGRRSAGVRHAVSFRRIAATGRHLSLDVVAGVLCAAAFAVATTGARVPVVFWWLLPVATWTVYAVDHLFDAHRTAAPLHTPRHRFHRRNAHLLIPAVILAAGAGLMGAILRLPGDLWFMALWISGASAAHLLLARHAGASIWPKELSAAAIYTAGIWFVPLSRAPGGPWIVVLVLLHGLAALLNLLMLSLYERRADARDGHGSAVRTWGETAARRTVGGLTLAGTGLAVATCGLGPSRMTLPAAVLVLLVCLPWCMLRWPRRFRPHGRYRVWGDLSFCLLALPWILDGWWVRVG